MGLISKIGSMFRSDPAAADTTLNHALALVTKSIDPELMALPGARDKLLPAIEFALDYYRRVVDQIPGPLPISTTSHGNDEILNTLFPTADEIGQGLGRSIAVRDSVAWFVDHGHKRVHAVMGMRLRPHAANGSAAFADHTFRSLGADERDTRECTCAAAFTSLIKAYTDRMKDKQREWGLLHTEGRLQQELKSRSETGNGTSEQASNEAFNQQMDRAVQGTSSQRAFDTLVDWLHAPEQRLRLETGEGHPMVGPVGEDGKCQVQMPTLASADRRKWLVCVVEFPLQEALDAIKRETQSHRYILI
jgi:hypothetical protein